jgi:hypothetical protein
MGRGLAARLWAYLEAEQFEPKGGGVESKVIGLGPPMLEALDLAGYARWRDAKRALSRAAERVTVEDARYQLVEIRKGVVGHDLYVVRRTDQQEIQQVAQVREIVRTSLR